MEKFIVQISFKLFTDEQKQDIISFFTQDIITKYMVNLNACTCEMFTLNENERKENERNGK